MNNKRDVNLAVKLFRIIGIDTNQQTVDADIQVESWWKIPEKETLPNRILEGITNKNYKKLDKEILQHKIWNPKLRISNLIEKYDTEIHHRVIEINDDYYIKEIKHFVARFKQDFLLHSFPFDYQHLTFRIESKREDKKINLIVNPTNITNSNKTHKVDDWYIPSMLQTNIDYLGSFPSVEVSLKLFRSSRYVMLNIVAINFLIHIATLSNITIEHNKPEDRLNISVMLLLIGVAFKMNNNDSLPNISYLTHMDKYHIAGLVFHSLTVVQNVISNEIGNANNFDLWSIIFLGGFLIMINSVFAIKGWLSRHRRKKEIGI